MQLFKKKAYTLYYENECLNCIEHNVTIGTQTWTGCNLNVTTYRNGDTIPQVTDPTAWSNLTTGAWCHYNNDPANDVIYGKLYNWYAVNDLRGLAPTGYHVSSDAEWTTLTDFLGGESVAGGKLKEVGLCHWLSPNTDATNTSLFTALPGGAREYDGVYSTIGLNGNWWSSTETGTNTAWARNINNGNGNAYRTFADKNAGQAVRLVQDEILSCLTIEVYPPILNPGTSHVVEYLDCDGISQIVMVPDGGTMVTICATEIIANNLNGLTQPLYTLCSPPEPLVCSTYSVDPGVGTTEVEGYIGYNIVNYLDCAGDPQTISVSAYQSTQEICASAITGGNNGAGAVLVSTGTCTEPVFFDITQVCNGSDVTLTVENVRGGSAGYQISQGTFETEALALANTSWVTGNTRTYLVPQSTTEYWISVKDSNGNIGTNFIFTQNCFNSLTSTRYPGIRSDSGSGSSTTACGYVSNPLTNIYIATQNVGMLTIGDRVFIGYAPNNTPFDGTSGVPNEDKYWIIALNQAYTDCTGGQNGERALINEEGFILELYCCPDNEQTNGV